MARKELLASTPLEGINTSFADYVKTKKAMLSTHMSGNGLPDYAYAMDYEYKKKLDAVPGLFKTLKRWIIPAIQREYQNYLKKGVKVSPNQFGEIYQMTCDCAKILGIGIPNVFVVSNLGGDEFNACSYAIDDQEPLIIITGLMIQRMTPGELKAVIGHECGHTQNNHTIYQYTAGVLASKGLSELIRIPGLNQIAGILSTGTVALLNMWSRASETTADRAAMICCDSLEDAYNVDKKLMYGGANLTGKVDINLDLEELKKQLDHINDSPYRYQEWIADHPISIRRIFAEMEFAKCETLYSWRPDLKQPGVKLQSKQATDEACKKIVGILKNKESRKK